MNSKTTRGFWELFDALPAEVQQSARKAFALWRTDPFHPSLHFKQITPGLWSARVNIQYRAMARRRGEEIVWFWIGTHAEYDRMIG